MALIKDYGNGVVVSGTRLLGTSTDATDLTENYTIDAIDLYFNSVRIASVPATATSDGVAGEYAVDADYAYFCIATNVWKRVAISTW